MTGLFIAARRNAEAGHYYWRITQWIMPWYTMVPPYGDNALNAHAPPDITFAAAIITVTGASNYTVYATSAWSATGATVAVSNTSTYGQFFIVPNTPVTASW